MKAGDKTTESDFQPPNGSDAPASCCGGVPHPPVLPDRSLADRDRYFSTRIGNARSSASVGVLQVLFTVVAPA